MLMLIEFNFYLLRSTEHSYDAIMDFHAWQNHLRSWEYSRSVQTNFNVCHCVGGSIGHWPADSALLPASDSVVSACTEIVLIVADSIHRDFCHSHQFVFIPVVHVGGELEP